MTSINDSHRTGKQAVPAMTSAATDHTTRMATKGAAVAMLGAPLLLVAAELLSPINDATDTSAERVADILEHSGRYTVAVLCLLGGMLLLVPAVLSLRRLVFSHDEQRAGAIGATLAAAGFMVFSVASGALGVGPSAWSTLDDTHRAALVEAFDAMDAGNGAMPFVQWGPFLALIGLVVLAIALWRHSPYPRWATVALPVGWAIFLSAPTHAVRSAGALVLLAGFMPVITSRASGRREPAWEPGHAIAVTRG